MKHHFLKVILAGILGISLFATGGCGTDKLDGLTKAQYGAMFEKVGDAFLGNHDTAKMSLRFEDEDDDETLARVGRMMRFYAAVVKSDKFQLSDRIFYFTIDDVDSAGSKGEIYLQLSYKNGRVNSTIMASNNDVPMAAKSGTTGEFITVSAEYDFETDTLNGFDFKELSNLFGDAEETWCTYSDGKVRTLVKDDSEEYRQFVKDLTDARTAYFATPWKKNNANFSEEYESVMSEEWN